MLGRHAGGSLAESLVCGLGELAVMPDRLSFEEAAGVPLAALTALQGLRDCGRVKPDDAVLINGASGGVGVYAIQIARVLGARVTTLSSEVNLALCARLGAHETLDYRAATPFAQRRWDCVFDVFGNRSFGEARPALAPLGTYVTTVPAARNVIDHVRTAVGFPRARLVVVESRGADLEHLADWLDAGIVKPVIDSVFALDDIAEAQRRVESRRAQGKVVIRVG
ncbi:MAG: NAD(P)-dependent alcohol dehydrogenase [Polyangiales bacterium]